jgi:hypothetical protein
MNSIWGPNFNVNVVAVFGIVLGIALIVAPALAWYSDRRSRLRR